MKEVYRSKISLTLIILFGVLMAGMLIFMLTLGAWPGVLIVLFVIGFVVHIAMNTYYTIDGDKLYVKCSFLINTEVNIPGITKITPTHSILSAPAMSFDRIEVFYNKFDSVVISPKDKAAFIARLKEINPRITVA